MSEVEKLARMLRVLIDIVGVFVVFVGVASLLGYGLDDSDKSATKRSGLKLHTDYLTGCQYFSSPNGGLVKRLDRDGVHICIADRDAS